MTLAEDTLEFTQGILVLEPHITAKCSIKLPCWTNNCWTLTISSQLGAVYKHIHTVTREKRCTPLITACASLLQRCSIRSGFHPGHRQTTGPMGRRQGHPAPHCCKTLRDCECTCVWQFACVHRLLIKCLWWWQFGRVCITLHVLMLI